MAEMVEMVARAIATYASGSADEWRNWEEEARAAIEAMREPDAETLRLAEKSLSATVTPLNEWQLQLAWSAMITAALGKD